MFKKTKTQIFSLLIIALFSATSILSMKRSREPDMTVKNCDFIEAVKQGRLLAVKEMLMRGVNINSQDDLGHTALMLAIIFEHPDIVNELLNQGANVNARTNTGVTPLMVAAQLGHLHIVKELFNRGADINTRDNYGNSALDAVNELLDRLEKKY